jgi:hypothetical protein
MHPDADRGGDLEIAIRALAAVGQFSARRFKLHEHFVGGPIEQLALLGQDEATRMAVEQRNRELLLQRAYLARDRRLGEAELLPRMCETARLCGGVKHL